MARWYSVTYRAGAETVEDVRVRGDALDGLRRVIARLGWQEVTVRPARGPHRTLKRIPGR